jgi:hypothetical protein
MPSSALSNSSSSNSGSHPSSKRSRVCGPSVGSGPRPVLVLRRNVSTDEELHLEPNGREKGQPNGDPRLHVVRKEEVRDHQRDDRESRGTEEPSPMLQLEDDRSVLVDEHAVLEVPVDRTGEHYALDVAADAFELLDGLAV